jgi:hypothetical protein
MTPPPNLQYKLNELSVLNASKLATTAAAVVLTTECTNPPTPWQAGVGGAGSDGKAHAKAKPNSKPQPVLPRWTCSIGSHSWS